MKNLKIDIMINNKFFTQFTYVYHEIFTLNMDDVRQKAVEKFSSLKNKEFTLYISNQKIIKR